jgi:thiamine pyrophosphate-dependent acetolactate synthase large subunit-like protein
VNALVDVNQPGEADLIIILGARTNYVIGHALPPRFSAEAKIPRIEIDPEEMGTSARNMDIPVVGDCKSVLQQIVRGGRCAHCRPLPALAPETGRNYPTDGDIHPLRLCEEIKNFMQREAILSVDGQEILAASRSRPSRPATGAIPGRSARWASACPSRPAPRPPSPARRSSACM